MSTKDRAEDATTLKSSQNKLPLNMSSIGETTIEINFDRSMSNS